MKKKKPIIAIILGTRPEIIKCAPVIDECRRRKLRFFVVHTGQHYSAELDAVFFRDLKLRPPKYNLGVGSLPAGEMIGRMIIGLHEILAREKPSVVLVQGDTNSVLAGAIAGHKAGAFVGHIEAGLRSFDRAMPEEINRIAIDAVSDILFAPTRGAHARLLREQIDKKRINMVGNTVVDAVQRNLVMARGRSAAVLRRFGLSQDGYAVLTLHRPSNVDDPERLALIMRSIADIPPEIIQKIVFPVHPRARERLIRLHIPIPANIIMVDPAGYLDFLALLSHARIAITDSGGIQEEACILHVPCVTLRDNTERPETLAVGANILARPNELLRAVVRMAKRARTWENPFGDGHAAERIIDIICAHL